MNETNVNAMLLSLSFIENTSNVSHIFVREWKNSEMVFSSFAVGFHAESLWTAFVQRGVNKQGRDDCWEKCCFKLETLPTTISICEPIYTLLQVQWSSEYNLNVFSSNSSYSTATVHRLFIQSKFSQNVWITAPAQLLAEPQWLKVFRHDVHL